MSRSFRRAPFVSWAGHTDKPWKTEWHRKMRATNRVALYDFDGDEDFLPHHREVSNMWASAKEGRAHFNPRQHPEWMRK